MLRAAQTALEFRKAGYEIPSSAIDRFVTLLVRPMYGDLYAPVLLSAPTSVVTIQAENRRWDVINLVSYNYLGLERLDEKFIEWLEASAYSLPSCGLSDARLVSAAMRGEASDPQGDPVDPIVSALRTEMAAFVGKEDCLVFSSGYMTNYSVFPHIVTNTTVVLLDELSHNSIWMGCRAGNPLSIVSFSHNSVADLTAKLEAVQARHACAEVLVVVEGIYSMEGTLVDLPAVAALKTTHRFTLLVDEAHSLFALGRTGRGVAEHFDLPPSVIDIHVGTFSKTPAAVGGFVAASTPLLTRVHTHAPYFSAADRSFPAVIAARVLYLLRNESPTKTVPRLARLRAATLWMRRALAAAGLVVQGAAESPILPLLVVYPWRAVAMGNLLRERGYGVVPAVPSRSNYFGAKLLVCVSAALTDAQIEGAVATIVEVGEAVGLIKRHGRQKCAKWRFSAHGEGSECRECDETTAVRAPPIDLFPELAKALATPNRVHVTKHDVHGLANLKSSRAAVAAAVCKYGLGACSAASHYGTYDAHRSLEATISASLGTERALVTSCGLNAVTSATAAMCLSQGAHVRHVVLCDGATRAAVLDGVAGKSKSVEVYFFDHCDAASFHRCLEAQVVAVGARRSKIAKRVLVTVIVEAVSDRTGRVFPLPAFLAVLTALESRHRRLRHRFFVDESNSFGILMARPTDSSSAARSSRCTMGLFAYHGIPIHPRKSPHVFAGTLTRAVASQGGFVAGNEVTAVTFIRNHRAYLYSCSLPPPAAVLAEHNLKHLLSNAAALSARLRGLTAAVRSRLSGSLEMKEQVDSPAGAAGWSEGEADSPLVVIRGATDRLASVAAAWSGRVQLDFVDESRAALKLTVLSDFPLEIYEQFCDLVNESRSVIYFQRVPIPACP